MVHYDWQNVHHYISKNLIAILNFRRTLKVNWGNTCDAHRFASKFNFMQV